MTAPTGEAVRAYYDERVEGKLRDFTEANPRIEAAIRTIAEWAPPRPKRILEIGCGIGATSWRMARAWPEAEVVGTDFSEESIRIAKACFQRPNLLYRAGVADAGFANGEFDLVVLMDVYEHIRVSERAALHATIASSLTSDSRIVLTVPTPAVLQYARDHSPRDLQPIDEDVTVAELLAFASETATQLLVYRLVSIWKQGDYFHAVLAVVLWSLDYISVDEQRYYRRVNRLLLRAVRSALARRRLLIIQDDERMRSFARALRIDPNSLDVCYLPVSIPPAPQEYCREPSAWTAPRRVMQIGALNASRSCTDFLLRQFKTSQNSFELFLHGTVEPDIGGELRATEPRPTISEKLVPFDELPAVVSTCSVGFIGNRLTHEQFFLLKSACGQLVEFLRCGKPVIVMGENNLTPHVTQQEVGFGVTNDAEFLKALDTIHTNYECFSRKATRLFYAHYNFEIYSAPLLRYLQRAAEGARHTWAP